MDPVKGPASEQRGRGRNALAGRLVAWLASALPSPRIALLGNLVWAAAIGGSAAIRLWAEGWASGERIVFIAAIYAAGAALAFAPGLYFGRLLSRGRADAGFAATFLALAVGTIGLVGLLFALDYRQYYATWHQPAFTVTWVFQFVFTTLSAFYQYLVLGLRLYFPLGIGALFVASLWHARSMR